MKFVQPATVGRYSSVTAVFPAPFDPAMVQQVGMGGSLRRNQLVSGGRFDFLYRFFEKLGALSER